MKVNDAAHAWGWAKAALAPIAIGLINQSWRVGPEHAPIAILQRLNTEIFSAEVHHDLHAVTTHLLLKGLRTPQLLPTVNGTRWLEKDGEIWRALSPIGAQTFEQLPRAPMAFSAGRLVGAFHGALSDLDWRFQSVRRGVHNTAAHMRSLEDALKDHRGHRLYDDVAPLAEALLQANLTLGPAPALTTRVVHGDLKLSNLRFEADEAVALIDLDTLGRGPLDVELGDAMRSWCNQGRESDAHARFSTEIFNHAMRGYATGNTEAPPSAEEWSAVPSGVERICAELAARFATDALEERYFGWDPRFGSRGAHNLARAIGQDALRTAVKQARPEMMRTVSALITC